MNAGDGLHGVLLVNLVAGLIAFFGNGENTGKGPRLEWIGWIGMHHPHAKPNVVTGIDES